MRNQFNIKLNKLMTTDVANHPKRAETEYPVLDLIKERWSPRAFSDEAVDRELLRQLFDAARWAPSSYNEQPWRFIVATRDEPAEFERLGDVLNEWNRKWATGAPVLGLTIVKETFSRNGSENRAAEHDLGQAIAYLSLEATRHDLYLHQMAGILPERARELYGIPGGYRPFTMFALGYLGDPDTLPENMQSGETANRSRKPIDEIVFRGDWNSREEL